MPRRAVTSPILSLICSEIALGISLRRLRMGLEEVRFSSNRVSPRREVLSWLG
jgi:hypothetical protein